MDNVLTIARDAFAAVGGDDIGSLLDRRNRQSRRAVSLLNKSGQILARMRNAHGQGWAALTREHIWQTVPGQSDYQLPEDFAELINNTVWDRTTYYSARGSLTPQQWQAYKSGLVDSVALTPRYRLRRGQSTGRVISLDPVPTEVEELVMEYISTLWLRSVDGKLRGRVTSDSDVPLIDSVLLRLDLEWRGRRSQGRNYSMELAEFERERDSRFGSDSAPTTINLSEDFDTGLYHPNVPESGYGL